MLSSHTHHLLHVPFTKLKLYHLEHLHISLSFNPTVNLFVLRQDLATQPRLALNSEKFICFFCLQSVGIKSVTITQALDIFKEVILGWLEGGSESEGRKTGWMDSMTQAVTAAKIHADRDSTDQAFECPYPEEGRGFWFSLTVSQSLLIGH